MFGALIVEDLSLVAYLPHSQYGTEAQVHQQNQGDDIYLNITSKS